MTVTPMVNPYKRRQPLAPHNKEMGRQSQQRVSNTKRAFQQAQSSNKKANRPRKIGEQLTLQGELAFVAERDCKICRLKALEKQGQAVTIPKRAHHPLCIRNKVTKGRGVVSELTRAIEMDEKRLQQHFNAPLETHERMSGKNCTREGMARFFAKRKPQQQTNKLKPPPTPMPKAGPTDFCQPVSRMVNDPAFAEKHKTKSAPLAMIAFAKEVEDRLNKDPQFFASHFDGLTIVVPSSEEAYKDPHYHSIVGQKLLLVDWLKAYGITPRCPDAQCQGTLKNDRTNFSKNKVLFPLFGLQGAPAWCMVQVMICTCCKRRFDANDSKVLVGIPAYAASAYPVETQYAFTNHNCHLSKDATNVFSSLMLTYGNGEFCSRLLYDAINRAYLDRITAYYSYWAVHHSSVATQTKEYIPKDGTFATLTGYPPLGDTIRDMYDEAASTSRNPWGISDHDRHTRELQSVSCDGGIIAQDHTFEVIKNYQRKLGAKAAWDCATHTGEIASVVLVPTTKTIHFAHAATALARRPTFQPKAKYSDTWPHKMEFWHALFPGIEGRLGLFHFEQRILRTLRKKHIDFMDAVTGLLAALYSFESADLEALLEALRTGALSNKKKKYTTQEIAELRETKCFRDRYGKYLRKKLHPPHTMVQLLDDWFCRYKVTASDPNDRPARGRLDPYHLCSLFTPDTKEAVVNCKEKAVFLGDPMPLPEMYDEIAPNPNSSHQLTEYLSKRGESKLESFHDRLQHFANSGMRDSLADNLHLAGTARYNLAIRHKRSLIMSANNAIATDERRLIPAGWEKIVPYYNHSELWYINKLAETAGCRIPFPRAEKLPADNGERFFSEYIKAMKKAQRYNDQDQCLCQICVDTRAVLFGEANQERDTVRKEATLPTKQRQLDNTSDNTVANPLPLTTQANQPRHFQPRNDPLSRQNNLQQHQVNLTRQIQPQLLQPNFSPAMMAPFIPISPAPMYFVAPQTTPCCHKYMQWTRRRVGRPPHEINCPQRRNMVNGVNYNALGQGVGWVGINQNGKNMSGIGHFTM